MRIHAIQTGTVAGETAQASTPGYFPRWHPYYRLGVKAWVAPHQEIGPQMQALGISANEVRWVVMTHLHTDHAGGLHHFPQAEILVSRKEYEAACGFMGKLRGYLPHRWPSWFAPRLDLVLRGMHGLTVLKEVKRLAPVVKVMVVTGHDVAHLAQAAWEAGADGYALKDLPWETFEQGMRAVLAGQAPLNLHHYFRL